MSWQSTPYTLLLFLAAVASFLWALYGIKTIRNGGRKPTVLAFVVLCLAVAIWAGVYALQLASTTLEAKRIAYIVLHLGGVAVPPAWLAFALAYTGRSDWLTPRTVGGLVALPLALLAALPTNPYSLALVDATVETHGSLTVLVTENGPLYLLYLAYSYVVIVAGSWLIVSYTVRSPTVLRRQAALMAGAALVPLGLNVCNVLAVPPFGDLGVNLTPVSLAISTTLIGAAILRYRLFDLTPIAREVVLTQMSDGVVVLDDRERIVDLNPAGERLLGDRDELLGTAAAVVLPRYDRLKRDTPFLVVLQETDEGERLVQLTRSPLTNAGETYGWVILAQDVTVPERQRRELSRRNERLDAFARVVSHDLRNPLAVIGGYAELAEETGERRHFDEIRATVTSMTTFLEDLLVLSRQGETVDERRAVSLAAVVADVERGLADADLAVDVDADVIVLADRNRLQQVLDNLFRNARDHGGEKVAVSVGALSDGFFVEDTGPGIPAETRATVFDVGFTTRTEGTGFGLAIVRDIVDAHGWSIAVTDGVAGGARFDITGVELVDG